MKKIISVAIIMLVLLSCLTACNFTQNVSGVLAGEAHATPKVNEMMSALADHRISDAKALLHPQVSESSDSAVEQLSLYIAEREIKSVELKSINVNSTAGINGKTREEQVAYTVTLSDDTVISINAVYLSDKDGLGFTSFKILLGVG